MKLTILCMGRTRERFIQEGIVKYVRFLKPYVSAEVKELKEEKIQDLRDAPAVRKKEAEKIFKTVPPGAHLVALDERGKEFTSHEFAGFLNSTLESGTKDLVFVLGGAMGLDETVTAAAKTVIALSRWTLTHEMARLVLLEQLYRAFTIIKGKTYHY
jgi:23S rRNA (pseudouridine1915-N3)-methyltransferase